MLKTVRDACRLHAMALDPGSLADATTTAAEFMVSHTVPAAKLKR